MTNTTVATTASVQTYVDNYMAGQASTFIKNYSATSNISVYQASTSNGSNDGTSWLSTGWGSAIGVSISGTYEPLLPGLTLITGSFTITGTCVATTEANN